MQFEERQPWATFSKLSTDRLKGLNLNSIAAQSEEVASIRPFLEVHHPAVQNDSLLPSCTNHPSHFPPSQRPLRTQKAKGFFIRFPRLLSTYKEDANAKQTSLQWFCNLQALALRPNAVTLVPPTFSLLSDAHFRGCGHRYAALATGLL